MLSEKCEIASPHLVEEVASQLHDSVIGFASGEHYTNSRTGFRHTLTTWELPIPDGTIEVRSKTDFTVPVTELGPRDASQVTINLPEGSAQGYGHLELYPVRDSGEVELEARGPEGLSGDLGAADVFRSVGVADAGEFREWVNQNIPSATETIIRRYASFMKMNGALSIGAAINMTERPDCLDVTHDVKIELRKIFKFNAQLDKEKRLIQVKYQDTRDYLGPLFVPADDLIVFPRFDDDHARSRILAPQNGGQYRREAESVIAKDRTIVTTGRLKEVLHLGTAAIEYAQGYLMGYLDTNFKIAPIMDDASDETRLGYEDGAAYKPF